MKNKKILAPIVAFGAIAMALASCGVTGNDSSKGGESSATSGQSNSSQSSSQSSEPAVIATGAHEYIDSDYSARTEILGKLEKYAIDHTLAGLPLYEDSGYQMFNPRVVKGTTDYVTNYGFGTMRYGYLNGTLSGESNPSYQNYYHTWTSTDPATINAWNASTSEVSSLFGNISASYFGTKLNSTKTGYEWYGVLASQDVPYPVENGEVSTKTPSATELHRTWRIHVRTGKKGGIAYRTASKLTDRKAYDGRYVELEDYVTAFKMMLNGANGLYRGTELASKTGKGAISGASTYYSKTKYAGEKGINESTSFDDVGVKSGTDADGDYIEFTFETPLNRFYTMYSISDGMYEPIPKDFISLIGIDNLGNYSKDKSSSPVDNILNLGPYMLESWETDKLISFKRNDDWWERVEDSNIYRIEGIHMDVLKGYSDDKNIAIKQFLAGKLDAAGIPSDYLEQYSTDSRTVEIPGDSAWKLNLNTCTPELWEQLFGTNGSITHTAKENYWNVKPWMSNDNFIRGLFYSIDRQSYAKLMGGTPSINYFSDAYMSDPETGVSYNSTKAHKDALANFWGDTVSTFGYSASLSQACFEAAIDELLASGDITSETNEITIEIWWMYANQIEDEGNLIGGYIKKAFDAAAEAKGLPVRLTVKQSAGSVWSDVYYKHLMIGQFDIGFGSISGNALDPLNFMEVLKSNNSSGFTLNWGADTSAIDTGEDALIYDGKIWSFDSLWSAADSGVILNENGEEISAVEVIVSSVVPTTDEVTFEGTIEIQNFDGLVVDLTCLCGTTDTSAYSDYFEIYGSGDDNWAGYPDASLKDVVLEQDSTNPYLYHFSFTADGTLGANIIENGGLTMISVDYSQSVKGVYGGTKSSYGDGSIPTQPSSDPSSIVL